MHLTRRPSNDTLYISLIAFVPLLGIEVGYEIINKSLMLDSILKLYAQLKQIVFLDLKLRCIASSMSYF